MKKVICILILCFTLLQFSCNNNCIHCVISDKFSEKDLTLQEIKKIIDNYIKKYGTIQLTLTGGEITIRKDFADGNQDYSYR